MAHITHLEVIQAKGGADYFGLADGMMVEVLRESPKFFFCKPRHVGRHFGHTEMKVSKTTGRCCGWAKEADSPTFNI